MCNSGRYVEVLKILEMVVKGYGLFKVKTGVKYKYRGLYSNIYSPVIYLDEINAENVEEREEIWHIQKPGLKREINKLFAENRMELCFSRRVFGLEVIITLEAAQRIQSMLAEDGQLYEVVYMVVEFGEQTEVISKEYELIGIDVAYLQGDNYSPLLGITIHRHTELIKYVDELNENELFCNRDHALNFLAAYQRLNESERKERWGLFYLYRVH